MPKRGTRKPKADPQAQPYEYKGTGALLRPEIGLQADFRQMKPPLYADSGARGV